MSKTVKNIYRVGASIASGMIMALPIIVLGTISAALMLGSAPLSCCCCYMFNKCNVQVLKDIFEGFTSFPFRLVSSKKPSKVGLIAGVTTEAYSILRDSEYSLIRAFSYAPAATSLALATVFAGVALTQKNNTAPLANFIKSAAQYISNDIRGR